MPVAQKSFLGAKHAQQMACDHNLEQMYKLFELIREAAKKGEYQVRIKTPDLPCSAKMIRTELEKLEYYVSETPYGIQISW